MGTGVLVGASGGGGSGGPRVPVSQARDHALEGPAAATGQTQRPVPSSTSLWLQTGHATSEPHLAQSRKWGQ